MVFVTNKDLYFKFYGQVVYVYLFHIISTVLSFLTYLLHQDTYVFNGQRPVHMLHGFKC